MSQETSHVEILPVDGAVVAELIKSSELIANQIKMRTFKGSWATTLILLNEQGQASKVLVGTEDPPPDPRSILFLFAKLAKNLPSTLTYSVTAGTLGEIDWEQAAIGWGLAAYKFTRYQKGKVKKQAPLQLPKAIDAQSVQHQIESIFLARDLINTPPNDLGPAELADMAQTVAEDCGASLKVIRGKELLEQNYPTIYAVGKGSAREPVLIDMTWGQEDHPKLTLVGKGVVFDTGGLDLKSAAGMILMKKDMGGGAITLALARLIMKQKLPVRLRLLLPAVENSPGTNAFRPSDIITTRKGITVEIGNTDAEGRLILSDALAEASTENPDLIIDMATLTGAARIALGQDLPGFWTPDDQLAAGLNQAATQVADPLWRMPLWLPYRKKLKTHIADINNMGNNTFAGSITAALFLYEFVKPVNAWVHFDCYGWRSDPVPGTPVGGEATALRAVFRFLANRYTA